MNSSGSNDEFEKAIRDYYSDLESRDILNVGFGDIFLEDLKEYREKLLAEFDLTGVYPIWKSSTRELAQDFIRNGFRTIICAANTEKFESDITGREFSEELVHAFDAAVDPCGENGEFHSFVFDGPIFSKPIRIDVGQRLDKSYDFHDSNGQSRKTFVRFRELTLRP